VLGSNIAESLLYFLPRAGREQKPRWLGQTAQLSLAVGTILSLLLYTTSSVWAAQFDNPELAGLLKIFALFPLADRILRLVPPAMIAEDRAGNAAGFTVLLGVTKLASAVVPCAMGMSLIHVFWTMNVCWLGLAALGLILLAKYIGLGILHVPKWANLMEQFGYLIPLLGGAVVGILQELFGQFVVATFLTTSDYAEYVNGAFELPLVGIWTASIAAAIMPELVRFGEQERRDAMLALWHRAFRKGALVVFPAAALTLIVADHVILTLYGAEYTRSTKPFVIYLFALPLRAVNYGIMFRAAGRNRAIFVGAAAGLAVNAAVTFLLIYMGRGTELVFMGPAFGYLAGAFAGVATLLLMMRKLIGVPLRSLLPVKDLVPVALVTLVSAAIAALTRWLPVDEVIASFTRDGVGGADISMVSIPAAAHCVVAAIVFAVVYLVVGFVTRTFDESERLLLVGFLRLRRS
jgi:O-antigen/teichoic acid export membrane protein